MSAPASPAPKRYSGMPAEGRKAWIVPRWLKEVFVAFALIAVAVVVAGKLAQRYGGAAERARGALEADDLAGPAPGFALPARGGGTVDLAKLKGKVVLVNFWATWCPPCREEEPSLRKLVSALSPGSFELVAVSVDEGWDPIDKYFGKARPPYAVALDRGAQVSRTYGTSKFPESYLIDASGNLRLKFVGPRDWMDRNVFVLLESLGAKRLN